MTRFAALLMIAVLGASQTTAQSDPFDFAAGGRIQEFVVSVSNIERTRAAFTDVLKWQVIEQGMADPSVSRLWGLDVDTPIKQVLVGNAESKYGYVRLVEIDRPDRQIIRPGGRWWDTGGMFNFNVLVRNLDASIRLDLCRLAGNLRTTGQCARQEHDHDRAGRYRRVVPGTPIPAIAGLAAVRRGIAH
jgi:hypothetical protein